MKHTKKHITSYALLVSAFFPAVSFAALDGVRDLLVSIRGILGLVVPIVTGLAVVYFFWGMGQFILHAGEQKTRDEGRSKMLWGIVALFVIFSIFGILHWIGNTIGISVTGTSSGNNNSSTPTTPTYGHPGVVVPCFEDPTQNGCQF